MVNEYPERSRKPPVTGAVFVDLPPDSIRQGGYVSTAIDQGELFFKKEFFFPEDSVRVAVKFMPEGGDLVPGVPQIVAFRAERSDARTAEVEGVVTTKGGGYRRPLRQRARRNGIVSDHPEDRGTLRCDRGGAHGGYAAHRAP